LRGQLLVKGFYNSVDESVDLFTAHRERLALAVVERQNEIEFFSNMLQTIAEVQDPKMRRIIMTRLEEVYIIGLKEKRAEESVKEDDSLAELAKKVMVVDAGHVGRWQDRK